MDTIYKKNTSNLSNGQDVYDDGELQQQIRLMHRNRNKDLRGSRLGSGCDSINIDKWTEKQYQEGTKNCQSLIIGSTQKNDQQENGLVMNITSSNPTTSQFSGENGSIRKNPSEKLVKNKCSQIDQLDPQNDIGKNWQKIQKRATEYKKEQKQWAKKHNSVNPLQKTIAQLKENCKQPKMQKQDQNEKTQAKTCFCCLI